MKFLNKIVAEYCPDHFWTKMQGYSLTFSPKNGNFFDENFEQNSGRILSGSFVDQNVGL